MKPSEVITYHMITSGRTASPGRTFPKAAANGAHWYRIISLQVKLPAHCRAGGCWADGLKRRAEAKQKVGMLTYQL